MPSIFGQIKRTRVGVRYCRVLILCLFGVVLKLARRGVMVSSTYIAVVTWLTTPQISELHKSEWYSDCQTRPFPRSSHLRTQLLHHISPTWSGSCPFPLLQNMTVVSTRCLGWFGMAGMLPVWFHWSQFFIAYIFFPALSRTRGIGIPLQYWTHVIAFTSIPLAIVIFFFYFRR